MGKNIRYSFSDITERDMDLLFMEEFACSARFLSLFTGIIGISTAVVVSLELSRTDVLLGESDITVIIGSEDKKIGLLIENKIDARAMPKQSERYFLRGEKGISSGDYDAFYVFIIAPRKYLSQNMEAQKYPNKVEYETILKYFEGSKDPRSEFKKHQIAQAIEKQKKGYQVIVDEAVTDFWSRYAMFRKSHYPGIYLLYNGGVKGPKASWPRFNTVINGLYIYHKTEFGFVDLNFEGCSEKITSIEKILSNTAEDLEESHYAVCPTGKSAVIRCEVPILDVHRPFDDQIDQVDAGLNAVKKLSDMVKLFDQNEIKALLAKK